MTTAIAKAFKSNKVMTLCELEAALVGFCIYLGCFKGKWVARCVIRRKKTLLKFEADGASPSKVVENLLRKIGGGNG